MVSESVQRVQNVRKFLALLAEDDKFRHDLQQDPRTALNYLSVLGNSAPVVTPSTAITLPPKDEVQRALENYDFALEHTTDIVEFQGWGAWAAWVFAFVAETGEEKKLN